MCLYLYLCVNVSVHACVYVCTYVCVSVHVKSVVCQIKNLYVWHVCQIFQNVKMISIFESVCVCMCLSVSVFLCVCVCVVSFINLVSLACFPNEPKSAKCEFV